MYRKSNVHVGGQLHIPYLVKPTGVAGLVKSYYFLRIWLYCLVTAFNLAAIFFHISVFFCFVILLLKEANNIFSVS